MNSVKTIVGAVMLAILNGCGGGGGGGGGEPAPSFSASASSVLLDEAITLTWSVPGVDSCRLSSASDSLGASGTITLSFRTAGMQTVSLTCTKGTAQNLVSTVSIAVSAATTYTVPTNLDAVQYPGSYATPTTRSADLASNPCQLDYSAVTYPQSWLGTRPLPAISGAPLNRAYLRGIYLKDIMLTDNPTFNTGCSGSLKAEFDRTVARLKKLNVDIAYIPQWHWIGVKADGSWYIVRAEDSFGPLSDADLSYFVKAAHAAGIKVLMNNQIQGVTQGNTAYVPAATPENYAKWFRAYTEFIRERAPFFQSIGIDAWELGCNGCVFGDAGRNTDEDAAHFAAQYKMLLPVMKAAYKGQVVMFANAWLLDVPEVFDAIDIVVTGAWDGGFVPTDQVPFDVPNYRNALLANSLTEAATAPWDRPGKSLLFSLGIQSRANWFALPGYMEETGCTAGIGDLNISPTQCIQKETSPDFSLQAIYFEAFFEALASRKFKGGVIVAPADMWQTDSLVSGTVFPNIGATIRNKPAEGIIKTWFAR